MDRSSPAISLYLRTVKGEELVECGRTGLTPAGVAHLFTGGNPVAVVAAVSDEVEALSGGEDLGSCD
jgi:hypothetical protein